MAAYDAHQFFPSPYFPSFNTQSLEIFSPSALFGSSVHIFHTTYSIHIFPLRFSNALLSISYLLDVFYSYFSFIHVKHTSLLLLALGFLLKIFPHKFCFLFSLKHSVCCLVFTGAFVLSQSFTFSHITHRFGCKSCIQCYLPHYSLINHAHSLLDAYSSLVVHLLLIA